MLGMALVTLVLVGFLVPSSLSQYKIVRHNPFASLTPTLAEYTSLPWDLALNARRAKEVIF